MMRRSCGVACAFVLATLIAPALQASPVDSEAARLEAGGRFDRGLVLFNDGDNGGALAEFRRAYELIENPLVLYNIGLVYAAMGRPVDAVDAFTRLLSAPGTLSVERLGLARRTLDEQKLRVAELRAATNVSATIEIDTVETAKTPLSKPIRLAAGTHIVGAIAPGYAPARKEITVAGGTTAELSFELLPMEGTLAHLVVHTQLPDASVIVDGAVVAKTPLAASLTLLPGTRKIELQRDGYTPASQTLTLGDGALGELTLNPEEDSRAVGFSGGDFVLKPSESEPVLTVDGKARGSYQGKIRLAVGAHHLLVERGGFYAVNRDVAISRGQSTEVTVNFEPTPETRATFAEHARNQRTWGWISGGAGIALGGFGAAFLGLNSAKKKDAHAAVTSADTAFADHTGPCDLATGKSDPATCDAFRASAYQHWNDAKNRDAIGYVSLGVGAAALGIGAYLLLTGDNPHKYDRRPPLLETAKRTVFPLLEVHPDSATFGLQGLF